MTDQSTPAKPVQPKQRRHARFRPDAEFLAALDLSNGSNSEKFRPGFWGMVFSESYGGCGIVTNSKQPIGQGQVGKMILFPFDILRETLFQGVASGQAGPPPISIEIRWVKDLGEGVRKVGVQYLSEFSV